MLQEEKRADNALDAVVFDMDGVIVDSEKYYFDAKEMILNDFGFDVDRNYFKKFMGTSYYSTWEIIKEEYNLEQSIEDLVELQEKTRHALIESHGYDAILNVIPFIKHLKENNIKLAIASASPMVEIKRVLESLELEGIFDKLVSAEEVTHSKPAPDVFLEAFSRLGVSPSVDKVLVIEDSINGVKAGIASGAYCFHYNNPEYALEADLDFDYEFSDFAELNLVKIKEILDKKM